SEFLSIASHQLRTPLTAMKGLSSMLLEGDYGDISEKPKKAVSQIFESSERMNKLVNNLLNISRIESGRLKFNFEEVNFQELVKGVVEELKIVAEDKGLSIDLKLPKNEIILKIDKQIIRQVILNFLDNSIKYTTVYANERRSPSLRDCGRPETARNLKPHLTSPSKGEETAGSAQAHNCINVKIEILKGDRLKEILKKTLRYGNAKIKIKSGDKFVVLSVKDRGRGVSTDEQSRLFEKFIRGNGVSTVYTEGTGLGLYVCRKMVEAHKGYIWIESAGEGSGSRFSFAVRMG
ncbi:MAG: HAMP domain-containing sensor histidine kinase, partial [bacterium]